MENPVCPKCNSAMQTGYILEEGDANRRSVSRWVEGVPEDAFWHGLKLSGRTQYFTKTFRCVQCGFLESYAGEPYRY